MLKFSKNIVIVLLNITYLFSFTIVFAKITLNEMEKKIIKKVAQSTVIIKNETKGIYGSGFVFEKNNKKYILTNAHVCRKNDENRMEVWSAINNERQESFNVRNYDKKSNEDLDFCFMDYNGKILSYDLERKSFFFKAFDFLDIINKNRKNNEVIHFTRNRIQNDDVLIRKSIFLSDIIKEHIFRDGKDLNGNVIFRNKKMSYIVDLKIVSGDSGSPLFYNNGKIMGVIFAQQRNLVNTDMDMIMTREEEEAIVSFGLATKFEEIYSEYNLL